MNKPNATPIIGNIIANLKILTNDTNCNNINEPANKANPCAAGLSNLFNVVN